MANTLRILNIDLAGVIGSLLLDMNSKYSVAFSPFNLYFGIGVLGIVAAALIQLGMKDIIKTKQWQDNMERISSATHKDDNKKNRFVFILK